MIPTSSETSPAKECRLLAAVRVLCYKSQRTVAACHKNIEVGDVVGLFFFFFFGGGGRPAGVTVVTPWQEWWNPERFALYTPREV